MYDSLKLELKTMAQLCNSRGYKQPVKRSDGKMYASYSEAAEDVGCTVSAIRQAGFTGIRIKGFTWELLWD